MTARRWSTPADVEARVRRRWADGSLLTSYAVGDSFPEIDLPLRGPKAAEIGDDLAGVQAWTAALASGSRGGRHYDLVLAPIGGRYFGRNLVPDRARVTSYAQAWRLLGVGPEVRAYDAILLDTAAVPAIRAWVVAHPLRALGVGEVWPQMVSAYQWLDGARGSGRYLREITAPGVDTKFVEQNRAVLAALLQVERTASGFAGALGLRVKPESVRLRFDPRVLGAPAGLTEATFRVDELASLDLRPACAVVVENETTYLTVPVPDHGVVLWGKGFEVDRVGRIGWLRDVRVHYWGDLDTHGFAILDRVRARLPQTTSFLMDRDTLVHHRDRWGREPTPTAARLTRLDADETALYADLVSDRLGDAVRLEQERIDWGWVRERLPYA